MSKKWIEFGNILKSKNSGTGSKYYLKLERGLVLNITGENFRGEKIEVELKGGDTMSLESPIEEVDRLAEHNAIDEQERERRLEWYSDGGKLSFIKYKIKIPPKREG